MWGVRWRGVGRGVEECGGRGKVCGGRVGVSLGGWCVGGAGEQDGLGAFPQLLDTMLPDVCRKHMPASMVKVYMSCVVSTPQTPVLDSSDQLWQYRNLQPECYLI